MPVLFLHFHSLLCVHWKPHGTEKKKGLNGYYFKSFQQSIFEFAYFPFLSLLGVWVFCLIFVCLLWLVNFLVLTFWNSTSSLSHAEFHCTRLHASDHLGFVAIYYIQDNLVPICTLATFMLGCIEDIQTLMIIQTW